MVCCISQAGAGTTWQGTLAGDTTWGPLQSPCTVASELTVPIRTTLTILPGTTVLFPEGVRMVVRGCLTAEGTEEQPIRLTRAADHGRWLGVQFRDTIQDNRIRHALFEYARTDDGMIGIERSRLLLDRVEFDHCDRRRIRTIDSSLIVRRCLFQDIFASNEAPTTDNLSEHIWGSGIPDGGWLVIEENTFGLCKGHNDAVDFDGPAQPHPIPHIRHNAFLGGGDDALDLECDALVEGNVFTNYRKDQYNRASGESNVLSAGAGKHYTLQNNVFVNGQHIAQVKDDAFLTFTNNTAVDISGAVIYFDLDLPGRRPGRGAHVANSIFWRAPIAFAGVVEQTDLAVDYSCLPSAWHSLGVGNIDADPLFVADGDCHLKSEAGRWNAEARGWVFDEVASPCIDAGDPNADWTAELWPNGGRIDMGAYGGTSQASMSLSVVGEDADLDHNAAIDAGDLQRLSLRWLANTSPLTEDLNRDGLVDLRDFSRLAVKWRTSPQPTQDPLEIGFGPGARWSSRQAGYDPSLPGYHIAGDIASVSLRAQGDDLPDRLVLTVQTSPGGVAMMEGFAFEAPCLRIHGEPFAEGGLSVSRRPDSAQLWQTASAISPAEYFRFERLDDEVRITFLPPAIHLLRTPCKLSWVDWYR